ncbi:MAG: IclR family transcriptional regulator [Alphaproteobacteria bacterium]|nr:IclR family transcriptional regulator [Rhodospirillales bacterium]MCW9044805.1 IclR family transcriptional regulator [Alphaproteobacteria bacterium]
METKAKKTSSVGQVQSLTRALTLLQCLSHADMGLALTEVSESLGLAPSTAHRLLNSMLQMGFVDLDPETGRWTVGVNAFSVGNAYLKKRDYIAQARPFMKQLMLQTGETSNMAILEGSSVVFVSQVECKEVMRMVVQVGNRGPLHASGVGKALLSTLPAKEALALIRQAGMPQLTGKTITTPSDYAQELEAIRKQGFAVDDEEQSMGLRCIAANIYDEFGDALAAISISGPTVRVSEARIPQLSAAVIDIANQITETIGGKAPS